MEIILNDLAKKPETKFQKAVVSHFLSVCKEFQGSNGKLSSHHLLGAIRRAKIRKGNSKVSKFIAGFEVG